MALSAHLEQLNMKHAQLDEKILAEMKHPAPDEFLLTKLKKLKLQIKQELSKFGSS
ncbi:MAG: DUF465 domain-containing protein [Robiginitomaculum sp.]